MSHNTASHAECLDFIFRQVIGETGIIGFIIFIALLGTCIRDLVIARRLAARNQRSFLWCLVEAMTISLPLMLLGGVTRLDTMARALEAGFEFVALGRALIRDPDLVRRMQAGELTASRCVPCNRCVIEMERDGTRCVERTDGSAGDAKQRHRASAGLASRR